jgi:hypothetical protein
MLQLLEAPPDECPGGLPRPVLRGVRNATKLVASAATARRASRTASKLRRAIAKLRGSALWTARLANKSVMDPDCVDVVFEQLGEAIYRAELLAAHP